jgi:hypothetical protein
LSRTRNGAPISSVKQAFYRLADEKRDTILLGQHMGPLAEARLRVYARGRSPDSLKMKNPAAPAVKREAEEDWGRGGRR